MECMHEVSHSQDWGVLPCQMPSLGSPTIRQNYLYHWNTPVFH